MKSLRQMLAITILLSIVGSATLQSVPHAFAERAHGGGQGEQELRRIVAAAQASAYRPTINGMEHERIYAVAHMLLQPDSYAPIPPLEDYKSSCPQSLDRAEFCGTDDIFYTHSILQNIFTVQITCCSTNNSWRMRLEGNLEGSLEGNLESAPYRASRLIRLKGYVNSFNSHLVRDTYQTQDRQEWTAIFAALVAPIPGISYTPSLPGTWALALHNMKALALYHNLTTATYATPQGEVFSPIAGAAHQGAIGVFLEMYASGDGDLYVET